MSVQSSSGTHLDLQQQGWHGLQFMRASSRYQTLLSVQGSGTKINHKERMQSLLIEHSTMTWPVINGSFTSAISVKSKCQELFTMTRKIVLVINSAIFNEAIELQLCCLMWFQSLWPWIIWLLYMYTTGWCDNIASNKMFLTKDHTHWFSLPTTKYPGSPPFNFLCVYGRAWEWG